MFLLHLFVEKIIIINFRVCFRTPLKIELMHRHYQSHFHGIQNTLTSGNKIHIINKGLESARQYRRHKRQHRFDPWVGKSPWRRKWQPAAVLLPGESRGRRSLACCSPWGRRVGQYWATEHASLGSEAFSLHALLKTHKTTMLSW